MFSGFLPSKLTGKSGGGGLVGSVIAFVIQIFFVFHKSSLFSDICLTFCSLMLGLIFVRKAEKYMFRRWGTRKRHNGKVTDHDFNETNIDEIHGQAVSALPVFIFPLQTIHLQLTALIISLIAFRFFDTLKLWPIKIIEKKAKGAMGVMFDDSVAGLMAASIMMIVIHFLK